MLRSFKRAWRQAMEQWAMAMQSNISAETNPAVAAFREEVLTLFPYQAEAKRWLSTQIGFEVEDVHSTRGGGFWCPDQNKVFLYTARQISPGCPPINSLPIHQATHPRIHRAIHQPIHQIIRPAIHPVKIPRQSDSDVSRETSAR